MKSFFILILLFIYVHNLKQNIFYDSLFPELDNNFSIVKGKKHKCPDNCMDCDTKIGTCKKCIHGFYYYFNTCIATCPSNTFADNISMACLAVKDNPIYLKAFTSSKCYNSCGKIFPDCSCDLSCRQNGSCCTDFQSCEKIFTFTSNSVKQLPGCQASAESKCLQCLANFFIFNGKCYSKCPEGTKPNERYKQCVDSKCDVDKCIQCDQHDWKSCIACEEGFVYNNTRCVNRCPKGTIADKEKGVCVKIGVSLAYYWIFPSVHSCKENCGKSIEMSDCSCSSECMQAGNCCDDFDQSCPEEKKKSLCLNCMSCNGAKCTKCNENSEYINGKCTCKAGFIYNEFQNKCLAVVVQQAKPSSDVMQIEVKSQSNGIDKMKAMLNNMFAFPKGISFNSTYPLHGIMINGGIAMNVYDGNDSPVIRKEHYDNENSFNNDTQVERNRNMGNVLIGGDGLFNQTDSSSTGKKQLEMVSNMKSQGDFEKELEEYMRWKKEGPSYNVTSWVIGDDGENDIKLNKVNIGKGNRQIDIIK